MAMRKIFLSTILFVSIFSCCLSESSVDEIIRSATVNTPVTADDFLLNMYGFPSLSSSELMNFQGVRTDFPGFTNYYLYYEADKNYVLRMIEDMPSKNADYGNLPDGCNPVVNPPSSETFYPTLDDLKDYEFWKPETIKDKEYYSCLKIPWEHTILFDKNSNSIFHVVNSSAD